MLALPAIIIALAFLLLYNAKAPLFSAIQRGFL